MSESKADVPDKWISVRIRDLFEVSYGKSLTKSKRQASGDYPVVGSSGVVGCHDQFLVEGAAIVVGRKGSVGSLTLLEKSSWPIDTVYFIQPPEGLNIKFVYYQLATKHLEDLDRSTTIPGLNRDDFYDVEFFLCGSEEQIRIVEKLEELFSDLDNGVAELKAAQIKLTQYRQSLLKSAVEGSLTEEWREKNTVSETGEQLLQRILKERRARWEAEKLAEFEAKGKKPPKNWQSKYPEPVQPDTSELPELPYGWVWASLDMLGDIVSGVTKGTKRKTPQETREVPYLRVANVQRGYLDLEEIKTIEATESDIEKYTLLVNDILFNEGGDRDKLGRGWVWEGQVDGCIHQNHVFRLRLYVEEMVPELISHYGNTFGKLWFQNAGKQTTNLASINKGILQSFPVPLAPIEEQIEIGEQLQEELDALGKQEESAQSGLALCEAQRKNILKDAFSGKLVPQDSKDEPAALLLERIKVEREKAVDQIKPKARKKKVIRQAMIMDTLEEALKSKADWVDAQEAFSICGVTTNTDVDRIEELYAELRELDKAGRLEIERHGNYDMLRLKAVSTQ